MSPNGRLFAILAFLNCLWAPVNLMVGWALGAGFSPVGIGLVRWIGIAIVFAVLTRLPNVVAKLKLRHPTARDFGLCLLLGLLLTGPAHLFYYIALRQTPSVEGAVFNTTGPLWTALFAGLILRETVGPRRWLALTIGAVGAYITAAGPALPNFHAGHAGPDALYLLGTLMETVAGVLLAALIRRSSGLTVFGAEAVGMIPVFLLAPIVFPAVLPLHIPPISWGWVPLAYLIFFAGSLAFGVWSTIVERAPLSLMVLSLAVQPPVAAILAYVALGERVTIQVAIGAALVLIALLVAVRDPAPTNPGGI